MKYFNKQAINNSELGSVTMTFKFVRFLCNVQYFSWVIQFEAAQNGGFLLNIRYL